MRLLTRPLLPVLCLTSAATAQPPSPSIANIRYELGFDSASAARRVVQVGMRFEVAAGAPVLLSLPAWTPGSYEISNFARRVLDFSATMNGRPLRWDKTDFDTWRVRPEGPGTVLVRFDFKADTLDNAMAWSRRDFLLVNGTNVFLYPETGSLDFSSRVAVRTRPGWRVVSGLDPDSAPPASRAAQEEVRYRASNYHDLVDAPFFIGRFDLDSVRIEDGWHRLATYPAGRFTGSQRREFWNQIRGFVPAATRVFGETPWRHYSTLIIFEPSYGGGSALEHGNSHVGIYNPGFIGNPILASITAHEFFHAWNVKRLRPAELVPYRYDRPQPTPLLWVSEGITDYYADLLLVRGGVIDSTVFLALTEGKIQNVTDRPAVALEDASLTTWIHPLDETEYIYYDKGSLAGLLLDILIRDAIDNRSSLDDVLRSLYRNTYLRGRGFTTEEFWTAVSEAAGGKSFADFAARYVDGREPFPWAQVAPLAGLRFRPDTMMIPRLGVVTAADSNRVIVTGVTEGGAAEAAGVELGDQLVRVGSIEARGDEWG
ncbi:MAG: M61 family metallopeptidase, partial [Gemmatimonadales bacterium]